ncbi:uncharacterized protein LOC142982671 [Anticarsia gemmatalis]|uniref:uncharacterized protein LOC142982671 n=1 Tax=Anticarsia gemmatalis TaxID=129554 RepID=UPI003F75B2D3
MAKYNYLHLAIYLLNVVCCFCYVNFEIFRGFDQYRNYTKAPVPFDPYYVPISSLDVANLSNYTNATNLNETVRTNTTNPTYIDLRPLKVKLKNFTKICKETEKPISLGAYEVPTQRDLVLFTKRTLLKMFNTYHEKTLMLLKDIHKAARAAHEYVKHCVAQSRLPYRNCIKMISRKCIIIVKGLVQTMELQKQAVSDLIEETTCNMTDMETDPIQLIKTLAMDEASLEFALPAFLRLIGGCSAHCSSLSAVQQASVRPTRHMTDQDLVIRHFLTRKNYIQLIKDSDAHVSGSKNAALVNWMHSAHS